MKNPLMMYEPQGENYGQRIQRINEIILNLGKKMNTEISREITVAQEAISGIEKYVQSMDKFFSQNEGQSPLDMIWEMQGYLSHLDHMLDVIDIHGL